MAKRKLSGSQRLALRKELKRRIAAGVKPVKFLEKIAAKYGLSTVTVRWYLKGLTNGKASKRKSAAKRKPVRKTRRRRRRAVRNVQAGTTALVRKARAAARDQAKRVANLNKLLPEYNRLRRSKTKLTRKLQSARKTERTVSRTLRKTNTRIRKEKCTSARCPTPSPSRLHAWHFSIGSWGRPLT